MIISEAESAIHFTLLFLCLFGNRHINTLVYLDLFLLSPLTCSLAMASEQVFLRPDSDWQVRFDSDWDVSPQLHRYHPLQYFLSGSGAVSNPCSRATLPVPCLSPEL